MLLDGLNLTEGSSVRNLAIEQGTQFPTDSSAGELFYRLDAPLAGLYVFSGQQWIKQLDSTQNTAGNAKFSILGTLLVGGLPARWYPERNVVLKSIYFSLGITPTGLASIDIQKNGVSILGPGEVLSCAAASNRSNVLPVNVPVLTTDYLTISVLTANGAFATVCLSYI